MEDRDRTCRFCEKEFSNIRNLTRHLNQQNCNSLSFPSKVNQSDTEALEIVNSITDPRLRFLCAQRLGIFIECLYPLVFPQLAPLFE